MKIYFTPGPSKLYPTIQGHIQEALKEDIGSLSHRSKVFEDLYQNIEKHLKLLLNIPKNYSIFFLSSATEGIERVIQNCVGKNSFHLVSGEFGDRFFQISGELGKKPEKQLVDINSEKTTELKISKEAELICFTHNETSNGSSLPLEYIYQTKKHYPDKLIAVDIVSSVPVVDLDFTMTDCVFFSVQKGFGLPAGLGALIISPRVLDKACSLEPKISTGSFHSFRSLKKYADKNQTPETPNVLLIYLFSKVLEDMLEIGISEIRKEAKKKAGLLYSFFDRHPSFQPYIANHKFRSQTVVTVNTDGIPLLERLRGEGLIVGGGYGKSKETQIRIANFPAHTIEDINKLLVAVKSFS